MYVKSCAKINLTLDITGRRKDGYHLLETIMQTVDLYDILEIKESDTLSVSTNRAGIPDGSGNIAYKAAECFYRETGIHGAVKIYIEKNIPDGAGMGGGSSNAAAVLAALNQLYNTKLSKQELEALSVQIGADVPFFIHGGTCFCKGIGEKLKPVENNLNPWVVICKPGIQISTKWAYEQIKPPYQTHARQTTVVLDAMRTGTLQPFCENLFNVMEQAVAPQYPDVLELKNQLYSLGAQAAMMTGSGSAVFGLFSSRKTAENACLHVKGADAFLTKFI